MRDKFIKDLVFDLVLQRNFIWAIFLFGKCGVLHI